MNELTKGEVRNYLSAAGFFVLTASFLLSLLTKTDDVNNFVDTNSNIRLIIGVGLLVIATLLIIFRKRDMIAILMFMMGFVNIFIAFTSTATLWSTILIAFLLLIALITLTSKDKKKWLLVLIPFILFVYRVIITCFGYNTTVYYVFFVILTVICLYFSFCCASEKFKLPGRKLLTSDEQTDFKASGSALGYILFAVLSSVYVIHYIFGDTIVSMEAGEVLGLIVGFLMIYLSILLLTVGKMRFTPIMFLLVALLSILTNYCSGIMFLGIAMLWVIIGIFAILRKESRILPGIMIIIYGCADFLYIYEITINSDVQVLSAILNAIPCLIAIYLAFVVYSQRNLPKF